MIGFLISFVAIFVIIDIGISVTCWGIMKGKEKVTEMTETIKAKRANK